MYKRSDMISMKKFFLFPVVVVFTLINLIFPQVTVEAANNSVVPIQWESFSKGNPTDENAKRIEQILLNTNKYGLTTWWDTKNNFDEQDGRYLDFGGTLEHEIRHPAAMSLGLATSIAFGIYDSSFTKVPKIEAINKTRKLISSLAYRHKSNSKGGWGDHWQSAHWAYFAGFAGWLMWDELSESDRELVRKMVEYEANRFINYTVPYWKAKNGNINYPGDTKAEENAWNSQILQLATAMMPKHENWNLWMIKNLELMISSASTSSDMNNETILHGKKVKEWVNGSNINEDGTVINHGFIHPDYMEFIAFNNTAALQYTLANMQTPKAAFFHSDLVYKGFVDLQFDSPPFHAPGGTIYRTDSSDIYYPSGNDWGTERRMQFATLDIFADVFGFDHLASKKGSYWEPLHAQKVLDMQKRHEDGRTYAAYDEDKYKGREEWVAHHAAWSWIAKWVNHSGKLKITNQSYGPTFKRLAGDNRYETAVKISKDGWTKAQIVIIARGDTFPDALAGVPLAYQHDAPILLTERDHLPETTKKEIGRLNAEKVIILGGHSAVGKKVEESFKNMNLKVERIGGKGRFETAREIAERIDNKTKTAVIVYGYNFPDALAAASIAAQKGYPILLTESQQIPYDTKQSLRNITKTYVVGGKSVIHDEVLHSLPNPTRIGGKNRYDTAARIIQDLSLSPEKIVLANGHAFPDSLAGSVLAAKQNANLLLAESQTVPRETADIFKIYNIQHFTVLGGQKVLDNQVVRILLK
ncbi:cell wall-binding repeat-containing protein [Bacillus alveayuensis]|uniref:cell wall-binding repeat-containing protein n=1 Tax=Aeribacillus alveayuensis TaxID=279215 RepID=UPI000697E226|nr:cell wall-binding repeat-containing protein [Bacillus alveayuensis]